MKRGAQAPILLLHLSTYCSSLCFHFFFKLLFLFFPHCSCSHHFLFQLLLSSSHMACLLSFHDRSLLPHCTSTLASSSTELNILLHVCMHARTVHPPTCSLSTRGDGRNPLGQDGAGLGPVPAVQGRWACLQGWTHHLQVRTYVRTYTRAHNIITSSMSLYLTYVIRTKTVQYVRIKIPMQFRTNSNTFPNQLSKCHNS